MFSVRQAGNRGRADLCGSSGTAGSSFCGGLRAPTCYLIAERAQARLPGEIIVRSWVRSGSRNCGRREAVTGKVRPDDHDDVKSRGVRHRYSRAQRLDRRRWHPELGSDQRRRLLLRRGVVDRCRRRRRGGVSRSGDIPSLLLELLGEMASGVGLLRAVCDENLHA